MAFRRKKRFSRSRKRFSRRKRSRGPASIGRRQKIGIRL